MEYDGNPKHKPIPAPDRRGSICPSDVDPQRLLDGSVVHGEKRFATDGQAAFCAQRHDRERDRWHGYPVDWSEVPPGVITAWLDGGVVDRRTLRRARRQ